MHHLSLILKNVHGKLEAHEDYVIVYGKNMQPIKAIRRSVNKIKHIQRHIDKHYKFKITALRF